MKLYTGTSGFSYKEWKGPFYPEKHKAGDMLAYYAERLTAVEINNTFYRLPNASVLEGWCEQTPAGFRFSIKASRRITHMKRLKEADEEVAYLLKTVESLGDRLGMVLYQLPPNLKKDTERLAAFLKLLDGSSARSVFEFRHESWLDDEVEGMLRDAGCALCIADVDEAPAPELVQTAPFAYVRLRREAYTDDDLAAWVKRVAGSGAEEAYVFFKHEDAGAGPKLAMRFAELAS